MRTVEEHIRELQHDPEYIAECLVLSLAEEILKHLQDRQMSIEDLATRIGENPRGIRGILRGRRCSIMTIAKIAAALHLRPRITLESLR